mgnify:CR=1 FL=1
MHPPFIKQLKHNMRHLVIIIIIALGYQSANAQLFSKEKINDKIRNSIENKYKEEINDIFYHIL